MKATGKCGARAGVRLGIHRGGVVRADEADGPVASFFKAAARAVGGMAWIQQLIAEAVPHRSGTVTAVPL